MLVTANLTGFLGAVVLWWQFALGVRPVSRLFSINYAALLKIHIWLGTYGLIFVLLHALLQVFEYDSGLAFLFVPSFGNEFYIHLSFGQISFILLLVIWLSSAILRQSIAYRPWKYIHYLSYSAGMLVYLHALDIGTFLAAYTWLQFIWYAMTMSYLTMVLWRIADGLLLTQFHYKLARVTRHTDRIVVYELEPFGGRRVMPEIGQYVYVTLHRFGESHPFSVMGYDQETGTITLGIKQQGSFTKKLAHIYVGDDIYISQPFGLFTREAHNDQPKVLIAGGIGVTPFIPLVDKYSANTYLFNCNSTLDNAVARDLLQEKLQDRYQDIITPDRLSARQLGQLPAEYLEKAKFFMCGPTGLMDAVKSELAAMGIPQSRIYTEDFSF